MSEQDLARVRDMFKSLETSNQADMRKRACDVIKKYANDPRFIDARPVLLDALGEVGSLPIETSK